RRTRRLVAFDMDSTLIRHEVIDELAREGGAYDRVSAITASAMRGELDFNQSLTQRVSLLKGLPVSTLEKVAQRLNLTEGADRLLPALQRFGHDTSRVACGVP